MRPGEHSHRVQRQFSSAGCLQRLENSKTACTIGLNQMKRFGGIVLSVLVFYAGIAWALDKCWAREGHSDHLASETHQDSKYSVGHSHASDDSSVLIHCSSVANRVGALMTPAKHKLLRPIERGLPFYLRSIVPPLIVPSGPTFPVSLNRILTFSFYADVAYHLSLSVLHI